MCLRRRPKQSRRTREISDNGLLQPNSGRQQGPIEGALLDSQPLTAINEQTSAPRDLSVSGISNAQRQTSPTESQGTAGTTIQMQETDTTSNHSSSEVSETKFLYSQAERLLVYSMEIWFKDNEFPGRHIMETALKQVRTATGTTSTRKHAPEPGFVRSKPYPSIELIDSILSCTEFSFDVNIWLTNWLISMNIREGPKYRLEIHS